MSNADIAVIGLAVMGENLVLNLESRGFHVAVYNRTYTRTEKFLTGRGKGKQLSGYKELTDLVQALKRPRKILLMIKAGAAVDAVIETLTPLLDKDDIIIDGGNSHFPDTQRRMENLKEKKLRYIGCGISGGEEGALKGPSMMPGGDPSAWEDVKPLLTAIAAKASDGEPCCSWIGKGGAGHFVKMVHNGIEYGYMQLIIEIYQILKEAGEFTNPEMAELFRQWDKTDLNSYLTEITAKILDWKDEDGSYLIDNIADRAGQKGTGKWTVQAALDQGVPLSVITEAVYSRSLSALTDIREKTGTGASISKLSSEEKKNLPESLRKALLLAEIISYAQGFTLIQKTSETNSWDIDKGEVAMIWRNGCIIRSALLYKIRDAFKRDNNLSSLLADPDFKKLIGETAGELRKVTALAISFGLPVPALSAAVNYLHGVQRETLPINLLQAQRDFFGAHTYERVDKPEGEFFHTDWSGLAGS